MRNYKQHPNRKNESRVIALNARKKKNLFKSVNLALILSLFTFFIVLSIQNNSFFLKEILLGSGIAFLLYLFHIFAEE